MLGPMPETDTVLFRTDPVMINHYTLNVVVRTITQLYQTQQDIVVTARSDEILPSCQNYSNWNNSISLEGYQILLQ